MNNQECLCIILSDKSNPLKGRLYFINFYLRGLVSKIFNDMKQKKYKKVLIKNDYNCFFPEKLLFYYMEDKNFINLKRKIIDDMKKLKIDKFKIFK